MTQTCSPEKPPGRNCAAPQPESAPPRRSRLPLLLAAGFLAVGAAFAARSTPWVREYQIKRASPEVLKSWAASSPRDPLLLYYLGTQHSNEGRLPEALAAFQRAALLQPRMARAHSGVAAVRLRMGQYAEAQDAARRAVALDPRSVDAQLLLGVAEFTTSKTKARIEFKKLTKLAPKRADAWHWQGHCARELNDFSGALPPLRKAVELEPGNGKYRRDLGRVLLDLGRFEPSRRELEEALKLTPQDPEVSYLLARVLSTTAREDVTLNRAESLMRQSIDLMRKDGSDSRNIAAVMVEWAEVLRQLKRSQEAMGVLRQARRLDPLNSRTLHFMGLNARALGNRAEAERLLVEYSRASAAEMEVSNLEERIRQDQENPTLRLRLARAYARVGNLPNAVNQYEVCLRLDPASSAARSEREQVLRKAGVASASAPRQDGAP